MYLSTNHDHGKLETMETKKTQLEEKQSSLRTANSPSKPQAPATCVDDE
jgi:hypothetical protein